MVIPGKIKSESHPGKHQQDEISDRLNAPTERFNQLLQSAFTISQPLRLGHVN